MNRLAEIMQKKERVIIGLMSGTSLDGIDAALVRIKGNYTDTSTELLVFKNYPFPDGIRERIFRLFDGDIKSKDICHMNFLLGEIFADAAVNIAKEYGMPLSKVDAVSSHGQTIYHIPDPIYDTGYEIRSTLQIGEGAVIARRTGVITVSDFRVMDMAAGGQGAPLVPYVDYILYASKDHNIALQNIGGIGNITILPRASGPERITAFDTGPGNMVVDELVRIITDQKSEYDKNGEIAARGTVNKEELILLMQSPYLHKSLPKTTGREEFGKQYTKALFQHLKEQGMSAEDMVATATAFTAESIAFSCREFSSCHIDRLIVGGGGAYNKTMLSMISAAMPGTKVLTQEQLGYSSDAKEAIAFAVLANEALSYRTNNLITATGAKTPQIMGKISLV